MQNQSPAPVRPEDILADEQNITHVDGLALRKGTIAAFLQNALRWSATPADDSQRTALAEEIVRALPALRALGVFAVFDLRDANLRALVSRHSS